MLAHSQACCRQSAATTCLLDGPHSIKNVLMKSTQFTYFNYELEALGVLEALMKWLNELMGGHTFTVVTNHKVLTYFKEKNHTAGHHIRWHNFFYGFNCKIIYIEGHKNKVADALSHYYSSSSNKDLHYDDFVSADIRIDKLGEDLPLSCAEEAWEMLFLNELHLVGVRIAARSLNIERDLQANQLNPPNDHIGRRELSLTNLVTPKENLQDLIETKDFLDKIQEDYSKQNAWKNILENPTLFPTFRVDTGFILHLNDLGKP